MRKHLSFVAASWFLVACSPQILQCPDGRMIRLDVDQEDQYEQYARGYEASMQDLSAGLAQVEVSFGGAAIEKTITKLQQDLDNESIRHRDALVAMLHALRTDPCGNPDSMNKLSSYSLVVQENANKLRLAQTTLQATLQEAAAAAQSLGGEFGEGVMLQALASVDTTVAEAISAARKAARGEEKFPPAPGQKLTSIFFELGSSQITPTEIQKLDAIRESGRLAGAGTLLLVGRTDGTVPGPYSRNESNYKLATERAERVATALGISNFQLIGVPSDTNEEESQDHRRVDAVWFPGRSKLEAWDFISADVQ